VVPLVGLVDLARSKSFVPQDVVPARCRPDLPLASVDDAAGDWFWNGNSGDRGWTGSEVYSFTTTTVAGGGSRARGKARLRTRQMAWCGAEPVETSRRIIEQWLTQQTPAANHNPRR